MRQVDQHPIALGATFAGQAGGLAESRRMQPSARLWLLSLGASVLVILGFAALQRFEYSLHPKHGPAVVHATEMAMRVVGIGHHVTAAFFLMTGARACTAAGRWWIGGLLAAGVALSTLFALSGGSRNPLTIVAFIMAFVAHSFHDEGFFHREYARAAGRDVRDPARALPWVEVAAMGILGLLLVPAWMAIAHGASRGGQKALGQHPDPHHRAVLQSILPGDWSTTEIVAVFALPFALALAVAGVRLVRARSSLREYRPVVLVLAGGVALVLSAGIGGLNMVNLVILMHFVSWFAFVTWRLGRAGSTPGAPARRPGLVAWLRGTRHGFWTLHLGCSAVVLALIVLNHYVVGKGPIVWAGLPLPNPISGTLGAEVFYYWTIVHVTLSLVPKGPRVAAPSGT